MIYYKISTKCKEGRNNEKKGQTLYETYREYLQKTKSKMVKLRHFLSGINLNVSG